MSIFSFTFPSALRKAALVVASFALSSAVSAQAPIAKIESLMSPAFLERGGLTVPASPGTALLAGDKLRTGKSARMLIALNEGSIVRLGENATFEVAKAERRSGVYTATLNVVEGAFRFTTRAIGRTQRRDVNISVARNATIGIRGTDLWGRGRGDKDIVCLIEGKIDVTGNNNKTLRLDQPLQFFQSTRTAPPEPVGYIDPKQLAQWATETDIPEGRGASENGAWRVVMTGFAGRDALLSASRVLRDSGFPVEKPADNSLVIAKLASEAEANELAGRLRTDYGLANARASK
jgi:hypothetical protein